MVLARTVVVVVVVAIVVLVVVVVYRESLDRFYASTGGSTCPDWNCTGKLFPGVEL